MAAQKTWTI